MTITSNPPYPTRILPFNAVTPYETRAIAEAADVPASVDRISVIHDGEVLGYIRDASGTSLTTNDGATWSPDIDRAGPEYWGYIGNNIVADKAALAAWIAWGDTRPIVAMGQLGQSNLNGTTDQVGGSMIIPRLGFFWDGNLSAGSEFITPEEGLHPLDVSGDGGVTYSNNMGLAFMREIVEREHRPVFATQHAAGSHPIENFLTDATVALNGWTKTAGGFTDFGDFMYADQAAALAAMPGSPSAFTDFAINLGEANADVDDFATLKAKILALLGDLYTAGVVDDNTNIMWSELPDGVTKSEHRIKFLLALASAQCDYPNLRIVRTDGLDMFDGLHVTGDALDILGKRYYEARVSTTHVFQGITVDEDFTPVCSDGTTDATLGSSLGHAHLMFQRVYDDNGRPIGIGGLADIYMEFTNIDVTGLSGNLRWSWENLMLGNLGDLPIRSRSGSSGKRTGNVQTDNVTFSGYLTSLAAGSNTQYATIVNSASGVIDTVIDETAINNGVSDVKMSINFPMDIL